MISKSQSAAHIGPVLSATCFYTLAFSFQSNLFSREVLLCSVKGAEIAGLPHSFKDYFNLTKAFYAVKFIFMNLSTC